MAPSTSRTATSITCRSSTRARAKRRAAAAHTANPTGIWVGDYTIQPENGGLGVFAHEYGHDLGLPDHYDTAGGSNGHGFWNIMASGSYLGDGIEDIGSSPGHLGAWDKLQLGWLNYELAQAGRFSTHGFGPAETNTKQAQGLIVSLPVESNVFYLYIPFVGTFSGQRLQFEFSSPSLPAASEFNDAQSYWHPAIPANSVIVPNTGTTINVINTSAQDSFMQVHVVPAK